MAKVLVWFIRIYQRTVSPLLLWLFGPACRFHPSCSQYAVEALEIHGVCKGSLYALWRILRCQPFSRGGYDPVPGHRDALSASGPERRT